MSLEQHRIIKEESNTSQDFYDRDGGYKRYHIETKPAPDIENSPSRFNVHVGRLGLLKLIVSEMIHYRGNKDVITSRPCVYGVFSGPVGGFAPREHLCVGCLRCTTQYPQFVKIEKNPKHRDIGDSYFTSVIV